MRVWRVPKPGVGPRMVTDEKDGWLRGEAARSGLVDESASRPWSVRKRHVTRARNVTCERHRRRRDGEAMQASDQVGAVRRPPKSKIWHVGARAAAARTALSAEHSEEELPLALVSFLDVEGIVTHKKRHEMIDVDRACHAAPRAVR